MPGEVFQFVGDAVESTDPHSQSWLGHSVGEEGCLVLTDRDGRLVGQAGYGARRFKLHGRINGRLVVREEWPDVGGDCATDNDAAAVFEASNTEKAFFAPVALEKALPVSARTVDVLVTYSDEAQQHLGNNFFAAIDNLVATMNQSFVASSLNGSTRIVGYRRVAGSNGDNVPGQVRTHLTALHQGTVPFEGLPAVRNALGADVVVHLVRLGGNADTCGSSRNRFSIHTADNAFGAIVAVNCLTSQHVFTHEIGHLLGGQHSGHHNGADDGYVNATFWPALLEANILGYTNATANGFRTLMGNETGGGTACTFVTGCPRINRWSSPIFSAVINGVSQPLGRSFVDPLGTARTTDMVKSLGGYVDLVTGTGSSGTIRLVAGNRIPNTAVPGIVSNVAAGVCNSTLNVTWASPAGTVGWYQWGRTSVPLASAGNFIPTGKSVTTDGAVSMPSGQATYFHVSACAAAGCSGYQSIGPLYPSTECL